MVNIKTYRLASERKLPSKLDPLETSPMDPTEECLNDAHAEWNLDWSLPKVSCLEWKNLLRKYPQEQAQKTTCTMRWKVLHDPAPCLFICKISKISPKKNSMPASASLEMPTPLRGFSPTHPVLPGARGQYQNAASTRKNWGLRVPWKSMVGRCISDLK